MGEPFASQSRDADGTWVVRTKRDPWALIGLVLLAGFGWAVVGVIRSRRHVVPTWVDVLMAGLGALFLYAILVGSLNRATIRLGREVLTVTRGPMPQGPALTFPTASIVNFRDVRTHGRKEGTSYPLHVLLADGREAPLGVSFGDEDDADAAVQALTQMLYDAQSPAG